jgi:hypothetical protein
VKPLKSVVDALNEDERAMFILFLCDQHFVNELINYQLWNIFQYLHVLRRFKVGRKKAFIMLTIIMAYCDLINETRSIVH